MSELIIVSFFTVAMMMLLMICSSCSGGNNFYDHRFKQMVDSSSVRYDRYSAFVSEQISISTSSRKTPI